MLALQQQTQISEIQKQTHLIKQKDTESRKQEQKTDQNSELNYLQQQFTEIVKLYLSRKSKQNVIQQSLNILNIIVKIAEYKNKTNLDKSFIYDNQHIVKKCFEKCQHREKIEEYSIEHLKQHIANISIKHHMHYVLSHHKTIFLFDNQHVSQKLDVILNNLKIKQSALHQYQSHLKDLIEIKNLILLEYEEHKIINQNILIKLQMILSILFKLNKNLKTNYSSKDIRQLIDESIIQIQKLI
ncbi:hypothetical protein AB837_00116 [bacterium AB1]|nr:hypothetical protein AB837_00116 [bacterium AB1]